MKHICGQRGRVIKSFGTANHPAYKLLCGPRRKEVVAEITRHGKR